MKKKSERKAKRHLKIRSKVKGSQERPRLVVFRSNLHIYGMLVDDAVGKTILSVSDKNLENKNLTKTEKAESVGKLLAEKAKKEKISKVVFDRAGYLYHGRVKALAEGARAGGLNF
ncbi:MAG TPA: 50S ribosomal protein L18 [Candidatus Nanoarchaeia archaeon]|nr:50S ribosomal protein L18 [uncultured archaeon]